MSKHVVKYSIAVELDKFSNIVGVLQAIGFSTYVIDKATKTVTPFKELKVVNITKNYQIHCLYNGIELPTNIIKILEDDHHNVLSYTIEKRVF